MATRYIAAATRGLFPLTGKTFQSFPSGLIRCDQEFVCRRENAAKSKQSLLSGFLFPQKPRSVGAVTDDGFIRFEEFETGPPFYIFPDAKESYDVPGFCKFSVSGYSYQIASGDGYNSVTLQSQIVNISKQFEEEVIAGEEEEPTEYVWTVSERWRVDSATYLGCVERLQSVSGPFKAAALDRRLINRQVIGEPAPGGQREISISWEIQQVSVTRNNFGLRDEFSSTETLVPYY